MIEANIDLRDAFFDEIYDIAIKDKDVILITADTDAFSLRKYRKDLPKQFINIGVAEQNMITVATGLALSGKRVFIYGIIPFITMRCYEHIKVNICGLNLPVTIIGLGAGLFYDNDGPTHHAVCDLAIMRTLPEITIFNLSDSVIASASVHMAYKMNDPVYVRLDKGKIPVLYDNNTDFSKGLSVIKTGSDICIIATGVMVHRAQEIAMELEKQNISVGVIDLYRVKPLNEEMLLEILDDSKRVATLEENIIVGGIGSIISEILTDNQRCVPLKRIALRDEQCFHYGTRDWLQKMYHIDKENALKQILIWMNNVKKTVN